MADPNDPSTTSASDDPMLPALAQVTGRIVELADVATLEMESDGWTGFEPGQFNMLSVFGVGEIPISISSALAAPRRIIHTVRDVGAVSHALSNLEPGAVLGLRGPFGAGWPVSSATGRDVIIAAGGLGLAPVRPILEHILADRAAYGRVSLLYGARSPADILFREDISGWKSRLDLSVEITVDHATADWHGHVGVVTRLFHAADFEPSNTTAFVCGPEIMMRFAANALTDAGVAADDIHLSMERNMQCGIGLCGHCQLGPVFICRDGPVFSWSRVRPLMAIKEL